MLIGNNVLDALDDLHKQGKTYSLITADPPAWNDTGLTMHERSHLSMAKRENQWREWCKNWIGKAQRILKPEGGMYVLGRSYQIDTLLPEYPDHTTLNWRMTDPEEYDQEYMSRKDKKLMKIDDEKYGVPANVRFTQAKFICLWKSGKPILMPAFEQTSQGSEIQMRMPGATYFCQDCNQVGPATDVFRHKLCSNKHTLYTRKPVSLYRQIFENHAKQRAVENILVLFGGSGTEMVAAREMNYPCDGIEISEDCRLYIEARLNVPEFESRLRRIDDLNIIAEMHHEVIPCAA